MSLLTGLADIGLVQISATIVLVIEVNILNKWKSSLIFFLSYLNTLFLTLKYVRKNGP
jgi:hypothetical protein